MLAQTNGVAPVSETVLLDVCSGTGTIGILAALAAQNRLQLTETAAPADEVVFKGANTTHVIGVEMCDPAVANSVTNAQLNHLKAYDTPDTPTADAVVVDGGGRSGTASFVSGRAEKVLPKLLSCSTKDFEEAPSGSSCNGLAEWLKPRLKKARAQQTAGAVSLRVCAIVDPAREGLHPDCLKAIRACPLITRLVYISCNPTKSLVRDGESLCMPASKKWAGEPFKPVRSCPVDLFPMSPHCELVVVFERESTQV
jgi:tRNA/tmRNA/rRNA uracil-C5-methylase (TrmA/RlmC/RlmD family)